MIKNATMNRRRPSTKDNPLGIVDRSEATMNRRRPSTKDNPLGIVNRSESLQNQLTLKASKSVSRNNKSLSQSVPKLPLVHPKSVNVSPAATKDSIIIRSVNPN